MVTSPAALSWGFTAATCALSAMPSLGLRSKRASIIGARPFSVPANWKSGFAM